MDRVRTFYRIAKENGRRLVVKLKDCYYYLKYMSQNGKLGVPNYDDDKDIVIYKPKQVGLWHLRRRRLFYGENATFARLPNAKMAAEISENSSRYLCALGYFRFASLIDIKSLPPAHSLHLLCKRAVQRRNDSEPRAGRQQLP